MNDCEKYQEMISSLIDGELDNADQAELTAHITVCDRCASLLRIYQGIFTTSDPQTGFADPPGELLIGVMSRIDGMKKSKKRRLRILYGALPAAAACIALVLLAARLLPGFGGGIQYDMATAKDNDNEAYTAGGEASEESVCDGTYITADQSSPDLGSSVSRYAIYGEEDYCATVEISGELPSLLEDYELTDDGSGTYYTYVPESLASALEELGYTVEYVAKSDGEGQILVLYVP